jgi:hypothetical protein
MCFITPSSHQGGVINATMRYARPQLELISQLNSDLPRACSARSTPRLSAELTATNHMLLCYEKIRTCYSTISVCTVHLVYIYVRLHLRLYLRSLFFPTTIYTSLWNDLLSITPRRRASVNNGREHEDTREREKPS